jgi:hypothetical protein
MTADGPSKAELQGELEALRVRLAEAEARPFPLTNRSNGEV